MYTCFIAGHGRYNVIASCDGTLQNAKQDKIGKHRQVIYICFNKKFIHCKIPVHTLKKILCEKINIAFLSVILIDLRLSQLSFMYKDWVPFYTTTQWRQAEVGLGLSLIAEDISRENISFKKTIYMTFQ